MEFSRYERKVPMIDAVRITEENMDEVCALVGHRVVLKNVPDKPSYRFIILHPGKARSGKRSRAYVGDWLTFSKGEAGKNWRVYPDRHFRNKFIVPE